MEFNRMDVSFWVFTILALLSMITGCNSATVWGCLICANVWSAVKYLKKG